jgi:acyl carrier protein
LFDVRCLSFLINSNEEISMDPIEQRVNEILARELGVDPSRIPSDTPIRDLGGPDTNWVEVVMAFEDEFGMEIPDDIAEMLWPARDLIAYIKQHGK